MASKKTQKKSKQNKKSKSSTLSNDKIGYICDAIFVGIVGINLFIFLGSFGICGVVGNVLSNFFFGLFGFCQYIMPFLFIAAAFYIMLVYRSDKTQVAMASVRMLYILFIYIGICTLIEIITHSDSPLGAVRCYQDGFNYHKGGGFFGGLFASLYIKTLGVVGSIIIDLIIAIVFLILHSRSNVLSDAIEGGAKSAKAKSQTRREIREKNKANKALLNQQVGENNVGVVTHKKRFHKQDDINLNVTVGSKTPDIDVKSDEMSEVKVNMQPVTPISVVDEPVNDLSVSSVDKISVASEASSVTRNVVKVNTPVTEEIDYIDDTMPMAEPESDSEPNIDSVAKPDNSSVDNTQPSENIKVSKNRSRNYKMPPKKLLERTKGANSADSEPELRATGDKLIKTLDIFGVKASLVEITQGPSVVRYEIKPATGVKVSKITNLSDDIKLNLAVEDVRIEAPVPGKDVVGIEIPNKNKSAVGFGDLVWSNEFRANNSKIGFAAGRDISGKVIIADIAKMPHVLVAGSTGSGKSVCMNTIIMSILYNATPDEVKFIMIDPKVVELSVYNGIPHLLLPVVTDPKLAANALNWAVKEMMARYELFQKAHVRDMKGYNSKIESGEFPVDDEGNVIADEKMYQLVIIIDELADLMMVASKEVEESICRIAQLARAAGIHLVVATQRPSADIVTGLIKANIPSRIAFAVSSAIDSRVILDTGGAERLLGKGDMLYFPQGLSAPLRVQGAFVSDSDVNNVVNWIKENNPISDEDKENIEQINEAATSAVAISNPSDDDERDMYFAAAGRLIIEKEKGSIGMIQRNFKVGFNRAARIMDQLHDAGVVAAEEGTKPRRILMTMEEFENIL